MRIGLNIKRTTISQHKSYILLSENSIQRSKSLMKNHVRNYSYGFTYIKALRQGKLYLHLFMHTEGFLTYSLFVKCHVKVTKAL